MVTMLVLMLSCSRPVDLYCLALDGWVLVDALGEMRDHTSPEPR